MSYELNAAPIMLVTVTVAFDENGDVAYRKTEERIFTLESYAINDEVLEANWENENVPDKHMTVKLVQGKSEIVLVS